MFLNLIKSDLEPFRKMMGIGLHLVTDVGDGFIAELRHFFGIGVYGPFVGTYKNMIEFVFSQSVIKISAISK